MRHPPSFRFAGSGAICPAAPHPGCTPSTPFARTLGAGRTERPPSLSVREKAPPPGLLPPGLRATRRVRALPHPLLECGGRDRRDSAHPPFRSPLRPSYATLVPRVTTRLASPRPTRSPPPLHACRGGTRDGVPPSRSRRSPPPGPHLFPLRLGAPPRPHALLRACRKRRRDGGAHKGRAAQRVPRARRARGRGGPRAMGPRARGHASVEDRTQGDRARGEGARNDGRCNPGSNRWRHEGCANRARRNPGEECCARAEQGCENEAEGSGVLPGAGKGGGVRAGAGYNRAGAARERKAARTVSAPPRPVDRLVENLVTYLANKFEFLLLVNE